MKAYALFNEYIWLVNTIASANGITLEDINDKWRMTNMSGGVSFSRSTFIRHKIAIEEMFGINIECDKRSNTYYISNKNVLHQNTIQKWMLSTLSTGQIIGDSMSLQDRIVIESVPACNSHLSTIMNAMKSRNRLIITYQKYGDDATKEVLIEPYCLKMFRQRWYIVALVDGKTYKTYSLDRIKEIETDASRFKYDESFNADSFFSDYYGILRMETVQCEKVILRAFGKERYYLRDLPLHHSQREIAECKEYADFQYRLRPTSDFTTHLLSRASQIKVIQPQWLADHVRDMALKTAQMYGEG